jgi:DNA replication protein DnaC
MIKDPERGELWRRCDCGEKKKVKRLMASSNITEEFKKIGFSSFKVDGKPETIKTAYITALDYYKRFNDIRNTKQNSIALLGQPGAGKTHLLTAVSNNLIAKGIGVLYFPWKEGFDDLKSDFSIIKSKISRMERAEVLFLDDVFKGRTEVTDFQLETLFGVVNYRYLNHLPILVSSERTFDEMMDIDEAIGSRLFERCKDFTVIYKGRELNHRLHG